ncbi:hypothetical protein [uncultured Oceanisphaera sp.]|uniref:hypothetical protein n=1 Tax=uncultured Oceanisphaera sp. TaxID=353858 RepID=UPI00262EE06E|nr:hypothetical protein [uncultured Oceanisphaera sp.]
MMNRNWLYVIALIPFLSYAAKGSGEVDHYRLDFNPDKEEMTLLACKNKGCSDLYKNNKTAVQITKDNNNEGNEIHFKKQDMSDGHGVVKYDSAHEGKCYPLRLKLKGNSTWPKPNDELSGLKCYINGDPNGSCKFCSDGDSEDENDDKLEGIDVEMELAGYVGISSEKAGVRIDDEKINGHSLKIEKIEGDDDNINVELRDQHGNLLSVGDEFTFPNTLYYNRVGEIEFDLEEVNDEAQEVDIEFDLIYVPYKLAWVKESEEVDCYSSNDFEYKTHASKCPVIGKAGDRLSLKLQAYDADNNAIKNEYIDDLDIDIDCEDDKEPGCIEIRELDENLNVIREFKQAEVEFDDQGAVIFTTDSEDGGGHIKNVALIEAYISASCAEEAEGDDDICLLETKGDTAIIGRTVPDRLFIEEQLGKIKDNVAYRGKPVDFENKPYFIVKGCAVDQKKDEECNLPSYSGEFAGGLKENYDFTIKELLEGTEFELDISEPSLGEHQFGLKPDSLIFSKTDPSAETSLKKLKLKLTIQEHDGLNKLNNKTTALADDDDMLRFGYLILEDTELPVETNGHITGKLYYLDQFKHSKPVTENHFRFASHIAGDANVAATAPEPADAVAPVLAVDNDGLGTDGIGVAGYDKAAEFDVELTVDKWLQPHKDGGLVQPTAQLKFTSDSRKRGNDSTFNRREVIR